MDKLLSIIVPVYKAEKHLDRCVESILSQTYGNIELVLVDDGSPDACPAMCDSWAKRDWRVRVIHKKNNGASSARNAGLDMASGEYIGFVDADDFVEPDMYETLMKNALENNADRSGCGYFDSSRPDEISADGKITVLSDKKLYNCLFRLRQAQQCLALRLFQKGDREDSFRRKPCHRRGLALQLRSEQECLGAGGYG